MAEEWGAWIEHDGWAPVLPSNLPVQVEIQVEGAGLREGDGASLSISEFLAIRGFFWRWQRVRTGWFSSARRRVCDDARYAPIVRYRFSLPPRASTALEELRRIAENPNAPLPERRPNREFAQ